MEGHTFTWLTFDESGKPLPEAGLSQILLDEQSLGGDLEEPATALQAIRSLSPGSSSVTDAAKSLAGHRGVRPSLEGHTFPRLTFEEAGKPLPEAGLSRILPDEQSLGGDLKELPITHISRHSSSAPWPTNGSAVSCDGWTSMQGQQLCQQP